MARTPSYTEEIDLIPGEVVDKPAKATAPDLTKWVAQLTHVDATTRLAGNTGKAVTFIMPTAAIKTARLRFGQAAAEMGIGVSFAEQHLKEDGENTRLLVSTAVRRERKPKDTATADTASAVVAPEAPRVAPPVGLPKPKAKAS